MPGRFSLPNRADGHIVGPQPRIARTFHVC
jgi:hypothetical protein